MAPLVIGTSPPAPSGTSSDASAAPDESAPLATTLAIPARDPRISRGTPRVRTLVTSELQALEAIYAGAPPSSDRADVARRLADVYADLGRATEEPGAAREAHRSALKYYEVLTVEYPLHPRLDEASYYAGLEHELAGDAKGARRSYYELITRHPSSRLIPFAYFAFGELFFAEASSDPSKDQLAEQAYREVLKFPPAQNPLYVEAQRRLAEIAMRRKGATTRP